ncbi:nucleotide disphospho-sugar-binding domain-containing protein [Amycolatopsis rubida]|uniref:UDP:flavonoid glycosyltransferase YjiC, YdhE family n=1 Tax=Amycolatopsis rubida TaxID=112413 RepID=A0A1I5TLH3_9PSEU|nr:nucleotide disphospho-sugar-binding domain-containing protein [Amycolatopsis rubida]SFP83873.1 UDP:flavonoid glycosyltransferase YjiC, YdhE family [Amycolatopsis rubida]
MRVLFTTWAWRSHLHALVPLAWAFRTAGHDVLVASQPGIAGEVARTGLPSVEVGAAVDAVGMVRGYLLPSGHVPAPVVSRRGPRVLDMFLAHAESMADGLVDTARQWRPDLLVFEPTALAGPVAAAAIGVPAVRHLYGTDLMARARPLLPDLLAPLAKRHGVGKFDPFGVLDVDPVPGGLRVPSDRSRVPMRYVPCTSPAPLPVTLPEKDTRPRICVTWGHTIFRLDPSRFLLPRVVEAVTGLDVVAAVSATQAARLANVPDDVRVVVDTSIDHVLPSCDLVIAHGGAGTVLTAAAHGVPQLLVPQLPDHAGHAARVLAAGVGEVLTPDEATPDRLRSEVSGLLRDDGVCAAASGLRRAVRDLPSPAEVVTVLTTVTPS